MFRDMIEMGPCIAMRASRLEPEGQRASRHGLGLVWKALPGMINDYVEYHLRSCTSPFTGNRGLKPKCDPQDSLVFSSHDTDVQDCHHTSLDNYDAYSSAQR